MKTLGIRPDKPSTTIGDLLRDVILGPERIERHKKLMWRMDALGMSAEEKVKLVASVVKEVGFDLDLQLDGIEYLIEQMEKRSIGM